jgi:hypothetical protein
MAVLLHIYLIDVEVLLNRNRRKLISQLSAAFITQLFICIISEVAYEGESGIARDRGGQEGETGAA